MVVTRFAPSPTGYLHIGGARTALFSWLWARHTGGKFILRIEDTDIKRNTPTATQQVIDDLRWLGIGWDEGPEVGGPNGPYIQSQRQQQGIYNKYASQLLNEAKAYYCFDTPEELKAMREKAVAENKNFIYPRPKDFPDAKVAERARTQGHPVTIRFAIPQDEPIVIQDIIRGDVTFSPRVLSDFIIIKSDGFPTYNFACVVDDYLMKVTHVIRGQEHLMNTPGQQALWKALDFGELPKYAHMSVTVSQGGGKLSKRERPKALWNAIKDLPEKYLYDDLCDVAQINVNEMKRFIGGKVSPDMPAIDAMAKHLGIKLPEINVVDFFRSGYLPESMVNFLALLGWNPGDNREIMLVDELIKAFELSRLTKSNSLFDRQKLIAFNTEHIKMTPREKLLRHFNDYLKIIASPVLSADDEQLKRIIDLCEGARTLADIERKSRFLFLGNDKIKYDGKAVQKVLKAPNFMLGVNPQASTERSRSDKPGGLPDNGLAMLKIVRDKLAQMQEFTEQGIEEMLRSLAKQNNVGLGKVAQPLRVALCGTTISLPIFDSVEMLGKEDTLARIDITLKKFVAETQ